MPAHKAKKHFLGLEGHQRMNCADAVCAAFAEYSKDCKDGACKGGGMSANNECGALCAARAILKNKNPEKAKELEEHFIALAGSAKCSEIRGLRKLSCAGCVEKAAEILSSCLK